jgi:gluconate 2-dehydrogenase gamma chain
LVDRRQLIAEMLVLVGCTALPSTAVAAIADRSAPAVGRRVFLDPADMAVLREMVDAMIPRTDTPGAADAGVPEFIDGLMIDWAGDGARERLRRVISDYRIFASSRNWTSAVPFETMVELDRRSFGAPAEDIGAEAYRWLKRLVFLAYRTSEAAFTSHVPNPGSYRGNLSRAEFDALIAEYSVRSA